VSSSSGAGSNQGVKRAARAERLRFESGRSHFRGVSNLASAAAVRRSHSAAASNTASSADGTTEVRLRTLPSRRSLSVGPGPFSECRERSRAIRGSEIASPAVALRLADPVAAFRNPFVSNRRWSECEPP